MCKRSFGGRSLPIHQKTPIYSFFCASPSGRHRTRSDKVSPSNWSSGLSILWHSKNLTRLLRERPFWGHFIPTPRWKKNEFWAFLQGDSGWLSYSQNTFVVSFWSFFLHLIEQRKKLNPLVCKRSFGGRSLPIHQKTPIYSFFCASPSGRHRTRSDKVSPSNWSSGLSILWHSKNLTRLLRERPFWGHFIPTPRWKKTNFDHFRKAILADSVTVRTR